jgi:hypothetical protein
VLPGFIFLSLLTEWQIKYILLQPTILIGDENLKQAQKKIVLFKSIRNSKRRNKGNFTSKYNSIKIKLCGGGGQPYLVLNKISTL